MKIAEMSIALTRELCAAVSPAVAGAPTLDRAAQTLVETLRDRFPESIALARVFATVPHGELPAGHRSFAERCAGEPLADDVPVLTLVGSAGVLDAWNDRRQSQGHVGIPLASSAFVEGIPMIARLLKELGLSLEWIDARDTGIVTRVLGDSVGVFHVEDAASATDKDGRKIISAQDFVAEHGIQSVFGIGGAYFGGTMVVLIVFSKEPVPRASAERFLPILSSFKSATVGLAAPRLVLGEAGESGGSDDAPA